MASIQNFKPHSEWPLSEQFTNSHKQLVVVIEDDYQSSMALSMVIDDWGYSCLPARCLCEAVQTLGHRLTSVAAIVTDVEIDGQLRGIKDAVALARSIGRAVPIIVTTGHAEFASAASSFPVLTKPFDLEHLRQWLDHSLKPEVNTRNARRQNYEAGTLHVRDRRQPQSKLKTV